MSVEGFRSQIERDYKEHPTGYGGSFGEILCYEIHSQPDNDRLHPGLTFKELADKWKINVAFLGEVIADHCKRL